MQPRRGDGGSGGMDVVVTAGCWRCGVSVVVWRVGGWKEAKESATGFPSRTALLGSDREVLKLSSGSRVHVILLIEKPLGAIRDYIPAFCGRYIVSDGPKRLLNQENNMNPGGAAWRHGVRLYHPKERRARRKGGGGKDDGLCQSGRVALKSFPWQPRNGIVRPSPDGVTL